MLRSLLFLSVVVSIRITAAPCLVDPLANYTKLGGDNNDDHIYIQADQSEGNFTRQQFSGSVQLQQGDKHLLAPQLHYDAEKKRVDSQSGMILAAPNLVISGTNGSYHFNEKTARFDTLDYYLDRKPNAAKGSAVHAEIDRNRNIDSFKNLTYTTCNRENPVWQLNAQQMTIHYDRHRGNVRNTTFRIGDVPVLWLPYFSFPIDGQRATGLLTPSFASSHSRGIEVKMPFYWNIAPNQDATFTLHPMSARGVMLESQYRYLGRQQSGEVNFSWLPNDRKYGEARGEVNVQHEYYFSPNWRSTIYYRNVSDQHYLADMTGALLREHEWYLDRYAALYGTGDWGQFTFKIQDYKQAVPHFDADNQPFSRLPQIVYRNHWQQGYWNFDFSTEAVRFYRHADGKNDRFRVNAALHYDLERSYGFIKPTISLDARYYTLARQKNQLHDEHISRVLPSFSFDSGLFFERDATLGAEHYAQTLEPRLFYLYTPYQDQSMLPLFDTTNSSLSWQSLFDRNRFIGSDRIGDAHQLTVAGTTRFYRHHDGSEKLRLSVGQTYYFSKRKVGLHGNIDDDNLRSALISEGNYQIDRHWHLYGLSFWDSSLHRNQGNILDLRYHIDQNRYFSIGHRYHRPHYDQITLNSGWKLGNDWRVFARYDYSLKEQQPINQMLAAEYSDCCWAWRLVGRHYREHPQDNAMEKGIYLEFIFKGLGTMGNDTKELLHQQLPDFQPLPEEVRF